jgi:hypothetical protein
MADLGDLISTVGGAATGGLLGTLGSLGTQALAFVIDRENAKQELEMKRVTNSHELAMLDKTSERGRQEAQETFALRNLEGKIEEIGKSYEGLAAAMADQTTLNGRASQWTVDIMTLVRPSLTVLLIIASFIFGLLQNANAYYQASMMATMAVAWWFGDRQFGQNRFIPQNRGK